MKERPILFSGPMIRALLDGFKTQTRREVKRNAAGRVQLGKKQWHVDDPNAVLACPYGQPGDRLWVRETFMANPYLASEYVYRATESESERYHSADHPWKPSIFMPRAASRFTLEITAVRLERLQEISEHDSEAEGCVSDFQHSANCDNEFCALSGGPGDCLGVHVSAKEQYRELWGKLNGADSWAKNPLVWVVSFKRITA